MEKTMEVQVLPTEKAAVDVAEKPDLLLHREKEIKTKEKENLFKNPFLVFELNLPRNLIVKFSNNIWFSELELFKRRIKEVTDYNVYERKDFADAQKNGWFVFKSWLGSNWDSCNYIELVFRNKNILIRLNVMKDEIKLKDLRLEEKQLLNFEYTDFFMYKKGRQIRSFDYEKWLVEIRNLAMAFFVDIFKSNKMTIAPRFENGADIIGRGFGYYIGRNDMFSVR